MKPDLSKPPVKCCCHNGVISDARCPIHPVSTEDDIASANLKMTVGQFKRLEYILTAMGRHELGGVDYANEALAILAAARNNG